MFRFFRTKSTSILSAVIAIILGWHLFSTSHADDIPLAESSSASAIERIQALELQITEASNIIESLVRRAGDLEKRTEEVANQASSILNLEKRLVDVEKAIGAIDKGSPRVAAEIEKILKETHCTRRMAKRNFDLAFSAHAALSPPIEGHREQHLISCGP